MEKLIQELPKSSLQEFGIDANCLAAGKRILDLKFPPNAFIIMIKRRESFILPGGSTIIEAGDCLMVQTDRDEDFKAVEICLSRPLG